MPEKSKPPSKDPAIEQLMRRNRVWVESKNIEDPEYFPTLGRGQSPTYLYIGCSDSRVSISSLTGLDLGHVFVHRNIANMVGTWIFGRHAVAVFVNPFWKFVCCSSCLTLLACLYIYQCRPIWICCQSLRMPWNTWKCSTFLWRVITTVVACELQSRRRITVQSSVLGCR